jgi:hypothetical protein
VSSSHPAATSTLEGFYVSFSGESSTPIENIYALSPSGAVVATDVLDPSATYRELRGMAIGPDLRLYVCQAHKHASNLLVFGAAAGAGGYTRPYEGTFASPFSSSGLLHPYQGIFGTDGNLYVSSQDTNVVTAFAGPGGSQPGSALPNAPFLLASYPAGTFNPGTFVAAASAAAGVPAFTPVPADQGGLTFSATGKSSHSVRGLAFDGDGHLYVADEGNNRVGVYAAKTGDFLGAITQSTNHSLENPVALWFDLPSGNLYIGSPGNARVFYFPVAQVPSQDFIAEVLVHDDDRLSKVSGIALDSTGLLYTCNRQTNEIDQWSTDGGFLQTFATGFEDSPEQILPIYTGFGEDFLHTGSLLMLPNEAATGLGESAGPAAGAPRAGEPAVIPSALAR